MATAGSLNTRHNMNRLFTIICLCLISGAAYGHNSVMTGITQSGLCKNSAPIIEESPNKLAVLPHLLEPEAGMKNIAVENFDFISRFLTRAADSDEIQYAHIVMDTPGTLADLLGDRITEIDSIAVEGPVNDDDFHTLWRSSWEGRLKIINLADASVEGGAIPDHAFFNKSVQVDWEAGHIYVLPLKKVVLPEGVTEIMDGAFGYNVNLTEINFPGSLRHIGKSAFANCRRLTCETLAFGDNLERIDLQAFYYCMGLKGDLTLPQSLKWIDFAVFYQCMITGVNIPDNLEYLGCMAFAGNYLERASLPDDCYLCEHGSQFDNILELTELHLPDGMEFVPEFICNNCMSLTTVNVPANAKFIGAYAFNGTAIESLDIPAGVERINVNAFQACDCLKRIVLPSSMSILEDRAFADCSKVSEIQCMAQTPPEWMDAVEENLRQRPFYGVPNDIVVYVPSGSKELYENAPGWKYFTNFKETEYFPSTSVGRTEDCNSNHDADMYDMCGIRINDPVAGQVYIRDGKKFIAR